MLQRDSFTSSVCVPTSTVCTCSCTALWKDSVESLLLSLERSMSVDSFGGKITPEGRPSVRTVWGWGDGDDKFITVLLEFHPFKQLVTFWAVKTMLLLFFLGSRRLVWISAESWRVETAVVELEASSPSSSSRTLSLGLGSRIRTDFVMDLDLKEEDKLKPTGCRSQQHSTCLLALDTVPAVFPLPAPPPFPGLSWRGRLHRGGSNSASGCSFSEEPWDWRHV